MPETDNELISVELDGVALNVATDGTFTIPAGTDLTPLFDESGFAGFMYLGNKFGMTAEGN